MKDMNTSKEGKKIEAIVEAKVKSIIDKLKASHEKFVDEDFGPTSTDEFGANSFYGSQLPAPAGSKYPKPEDLKWERPQYDDSHFTSTDLKKKGEEDDEEEAEGGDDNDEEDEYGPKSKVEDEVSIIR